jgi:hypothetical protein
MNKMSESACLLFIAGACVFSFGCAKQAPPRVYERPIPLEATPTPKAVAKSDSKLPPPEAADVKHAIDRVFKGSVSILTDRDPYFIAGDFNGDSSQDLAVAVSPMPGKVLTINDELAPWVIVDPIRLAKPLPNGAAEHHIEMMTRKRRAIVSDGDVLLAIIHGYESKGWRDPQATQTYILKGAAGSRMEPQGRKKIVWAGNEDRLPRIWGDVIAQTVEERQGFLYYNGAKYGWYDPRTYQPETANLPRTGHGKVAKAMQ